MKEPQNSYSARRDYETSQIDYLLPEWITNLKNYFEKRPAPNYSDYHAHPDYKV